MPITPEQYKKINKKNRPHFDSEQYKLVYIDPNEIELDVPVDEAHVESLRQSIQKSGQLTPILVRRSVVKSKGELPVIDGFHRVAAMQKLGMSIAANETDCDDDDFWTARIVSATQHEGVKTDRAALWVNELWNASPHTNKYKTVTAAISATDTGKATPEVVALVKKWTDAWGIANKTLRMWVGYGTTHPEKIVPVETKNPPVETKPKEPEIHATMKAYYGNLGIVIEGSRNMNSDNMTKQEIKEYLIRMAETIEALKLAMKALGGK